MTDVINSDNSDNSAIQKHRASLPIAAHRAALIATVVRERRLVVVAETGSGKSTQIPQFLLDAPEINASPTRRIVVTQPRRVAAVSVARRVAEERGQAEPGGEIAFAVRFESNVSPEVTRCVFMTDGLLLNELVRDPLLPGVGCIVLDEAHERSLSTDLLFGLVLELSRKRADLLVLVMSATLDSDKFSRFFLDAPVLQVAGRAFPVVERFKCSFPGASHAARVQPLKPNFDFVSAAVDAAFEIHLEEPPGDVLVFLPGQEHIDRAVAQLSARLQALFRDEPTLFDSMRTPNCLVLPLYAALPPQRQAAVFRPTPPETRKFVFATTVAETSVTIPGIVFVVDSGFCKVANFVNGVETLDIEPISRVQAVQRQGRAGRTQSGVCVRLYSEVQLEQLAAITLPELQRVSLARAVLVLKCCGVADVLAFALVDKPPAHSITAAAHHLHCIGALDADGALTDLGRTMGRLPLDPPLARCLLEAQRLECVDPVTRVVALLSVVDQLFCSSDDKRAQERAQSELRRVRDDAERRYGTGDHFFLLELSYLLDKASSDGTRSVHELCDRLLLRQRSASESRDVRRQLLQALGNKAASGTETRDYSLILKCISIGFFNNSAKRQANSTAFRHLGESPISSYIHPSSVLAGHEQDLLWVVFHQQVHTSRHFLKTVSPVRFGWIETQMRLKVTCDLRRLMGPSYVDAVSNNAAVTAQTDVDAPPTTAPSSTLTAARRHDDNAVDDARARYLSRRASAAVGLSSESAKRSKR
jgi:HrpA-like RNA helicase